MSKAGEKRYAARKLVELWTECGVTREEASDCEECILLTHSSSYNIYMFSSMYSRINALRKAEADQLRAEADQLRTEADQLRAEVDRLRTAAARAIAELASPGPKDLGKDPFRHSSPE
jgi:hypothetical protein